MNSKNGDLTTLNIFKKIFGVPGLPMKFKYISKNKMVKFKYGNDYSIYISLNDIGINISNDKDIDPKEILNMVIKRFIFLSLKEKIL